jgi:hypothetical protein
MQSLLIIEEPRAPAPRRFALWDLGFRPFYLLASMFAALSIALLLGGLPLAYLGRQFINGEYRNHGTTARGFEGRQIFSTDGGSQTECAVRPLRFANRQWITVHTGNS